MYLGGGGSGGGLQGSSQGRCLSMCESGVQGDVYDIVQCQRVCKALSQVVPASCDDSEAAML